MAENIAAAAEVVKTAVSVIKKAENLTPRAQEIQKTIVTERDWRLAGGLSGILGCVYMYFIAGSVDSLAAVISIPISALFSVFLLFSAWSNARIVKKLRNGKITVFDADGTVTGAVRRDRKKGFAPLWFMSPFSVYVLVDFIVCLFSINPLFVIGIPLAVALICGIVSAAKQRDILKTPDPALNERKSPFAATIIAAIGFPIATVLAWLVYFVSYGTIVLVPVVLALLSSICISAIILLHLKTVDFIRGYYVASKSDKQVDGLIGENERGENKIMVIFDKVTTMSGDIIKKINYPLEQFNIMLGNIKSIVSYLAWLIPLISSALKFFKII